MRFTILALALMMVGCSGKKTVDCARSVVYISKPIEGISGPASQLYSAEAGTWTCTGDAGDLRCKFCAGGKPKEMQ